MPVELATVLDSGSVDQTLELAATAGRCADDDLLSIPEHRAANSPAGEFVRAEEAHSLEEVWFTGIEHLGFDLWRCAVGARTGSS